MTATEALSAELEDYLESIARLIRDRGRARVRDIAAGLSVHKSTVTAALHSLADKGLIDYTPYSLPTLTRAGSQVADRVQRQHDVLKRFLCDVLLVDAGLAETNACRIEHAVDKAVLEHLTRFMDFVQCCPRGGAKWIRGYEHSCDSDPTRDKCERCMEIALQEFRAGRNTAREETFTMTLDKLRSGQRARIHRVGRADPVTRRLVDMGVVPGTAVEVVKVAPLGDPIEIKVKGYSLTLRKEEAATITVEPVAEAAP
ncbi:MAG: hypothetical protein A3K19_06535 [Lentisphaerae bacterium RIFOXYB12_FULL_65_16]|nr:MAG: hypothetical protein A3K18_02105 [Lentisphaerae bacterium RIFOXYA12_64_32]OGV93096.1 MAG: hypothetical protein A3K19_06535 [Lentisphaerae bacterium RIFOXYB12_FULL_65_16]